MSIVTSGLLSVIIIIGLVTGLIFFVRSSGASGLKIMLLGISIILSGGIIVVDPGSNLGGVEYLIVFIGLIISLVGLGKKD